MSNESIGTARLDVIVDLSQFDTAIVSAKRSVSSMSQEAQAAYNQLSAAEKRRVDSLIKQADTLGYTRQQQILYNAALKGIPTTILDELKTKLASVAQASDVVAESAAEQASRLKDVVRASLDRVNAEQAAMAAQQRAIPVNDAERAAIERVKKAADDRVTIAQRGQSIMAAEARVRQQSAVSVQDEAIALQKLLGKIDPVNAALERLDRMETQLRSHRSKGSISQDDFDAYTGKISKARDEITKADGALGHFTFSSAGARREFGYLIAEVARGDFGALRGSLSTLANRSGLLTAVLSPMGLAISAAALALGGFAAAVITVTDHEEALNRSIIATGDFAGKTTGQLSDMVDALGNVPGNGGNAQKVLQSLVMSGKVTGDRLQEAAQASIDFATITGKSIDQAVDAFVRLQDDPVKAAKDLDDQLHFLTATQYENIKALQAQGDSEAAAAIAQTAASVAFRQRALEIQSSQNIIERGWNRIKEATESALQAMGKIGSASSNASIVTTANEDLASYKRNAHLPASASDADLLATVRNGSTTGGDSIGLIQGAMNRRAAASSGAVFESWVAQTQGDAAKANDILKRDSDTWDKLLAGAKSDATKQKEIAAIKDLARRDIANDPNNKDTYLKNEQTALAQIEKKYEDHAGDSASRALDHAGESAQTQAFKTALTQLDDAFKNSQRELDAARKAGTKSEADYYQESQNLLWQNEAVEITAIQAEIDRLQKRKVIGAERVKNEARIAELMGQASKIEADTIAKSNALGEQQKASYQKRQQAIDAYRQALDKANDSLQAQVNAEVARIGMGDREYQLQQNINQAYVDQAAKLQDLALKRQAGSRGEQGGIDAEQYDADVAALQAATDRRVAITKDGYERQKSAEADWQKGLSRGYENWIDEASNAASQAASVTTNAFDSMAGALATFATTGKSSFKSLVTSILSDLAKMEMRIAASKILQSVIGSYFGADTSGTTAGANAGIADQISKSTASINWTPNAKGGVYDSPSLSAFSGQVVSSPTMFAFAKGAGIMGEAGPEAIMPLTRGSDGKLGVKSTGGGGDIHIEQNYAFTGTGESTEQTKASGGNADMARQFGDRMKQVSLATIAQEMRPGGIIWRMKNA